MRGKRLSIGLRAALAIFAAALLMTSTWAAAQENILHNFNGTDGAGPQAGLVMDAAGNLYGTTYNGGTYNYGTVFELTPAAGGGWTEMVLHDFNNDGVDGAYPQAGLIFDAAGNLYGTTHSGGTHNASCSNDCGTVFELTPSAGGTWTEKVLYDFYSIRTDGAFPASSLIFDGAGNLYGVRVDARSGRGLDGEGAL